jgi:Tol biopolymer transport system component
VEDAMTGNQGESAEPYQRRARVLAPALVAVAMLAFGLAGARAADAPSGKLVFSRDDGIYVLNTDSSSPTRVWTAAAGRQGANPRWSPDGSRIAFEGPDGNIWVMAADGSNAHAVTSQAVAPSGCGGDACTQPGTTADSVRWSPDGSAISYRLVRDLARGSIWTLPLAGGSPQLVAQTDGLCIFNEGWSPDGRPLFSRCAQDGSPSNATYASATAGSSVSSAFLAGSQLAFSGDGSRLAFSNQSLTNGAMTVTLFVGAADGSSVQNVADGGQNPAWSKSGLLAYHVGGPNGWTIHVYDPSTSSDTTIANGMLGGWTADGGWIYYTTVDNGQQIWRVRMDGTGATLITSGSAPDWTR